MNDAPSEAIKHAAVTLVTSPNAPQLYEYLGAVIRLTERYPVKLAGEAATLNPLIGLAKHDPPKYRLVMDFVNKKRAALGYEPLSEDAAKPKSSREKKVAYMREFMDEKRERERLAAEIENLRRPEKDRIVGNARLEFMRRQSMRWKELRDEALSRAAPTGGKLNAEARKAVLDRFWAAVDADLEAKLQRAKKEALDPHRRPASDDMTELMEALNLPPR